MEKLSDFTKDLLEKITYFGHDDKSLELAILSSVIKYLEKEQKKIDKELMEEKKFVFRRIIRKRSRIMS
jgi:hypothetical protein